MGLLNHKLGAGCDLHTSTTSLSVNRKAYLQAGGRVAKGSLQEHIPPSPPRAPLGAEAAEASQKATAYGKETPLEVHRLEDVSPAGREPVKVRKDFLKMSRHVFGVGGVFYHGEGRVLTAASRAGVRVRSWGFVIGVQDCFTTASPGWGGLEDAPSGFCSSMSLAPAPFETT